MDEKIYEHTLCHPAPPGTDRPLTTGPSDVGGTGMHAERGAGCSSLAVAHVVAEVGSATLAEVHVSAEGGSEPLAVVHVSAEGGSATLVVVRRRFGFGASSRAAAAAAVCGRPRGCERVVRESVFV